MRNKTIRAEIFFVMAVAGFGAGCLAQGVWGGSVSERRVASAAPSLESTNAYDKITCPPESEYRAVAAKLNLPVPPNLVVCADPTHGRLAKLFRYASELRLAFSPEWAPLLQRELRDPIGYLDEMSTKVDFDFNQVTSIAFNRTKEKSIYLGGLFFESSPLEALSTLVHEARHSSAQDPGHVTCRLGDIPKSDGGCDTELSLNPAKAGAYSYGAAFSVALGLFGENLSKGDREFMLSDGLGVVGTRFNNLAPELAQAHDLVAVLGADGSVSLLSPFGEPVPLVLDFLREGEKVVRLEFNVRNNGLLLFTSAQRLLTWTPDSGFQAMYKGTLDPEAKIVDAARIRVPFGEYPFYNFLLAGNDLRYVMFNSDVKKYILAPYPMKGLMRESNPPQIARFFMGLNGGAFFLDSGGHFSVGARYGGDEAFGILENLNAFGWRHGSGGVMSESLFGVTSEGVIKSASVEIVKRDDWDEYGSEVFHWADSGFQAPVGQRAVKFQEGLFLRGLLDDQGTLHFGNFAGSQQFDVIGVVKDFAVFRTHSVSGELVPTGAVESKCGAHGVVREPWYGHELGLDAAGQLVENCKPLSKSVYRSLRLLPASEIGADSPSPSSEPARLELVNASGQVEILRPYEKR